jgi:hypothetical protein
MIRPLEKVFVDVKEDINGENGIGMNVTFPEKKESRNVWCDPGITFPSSVLDSLLLINASVQIRGQREVVYASPVPIAAAVRMGEVIFTMHHMSEHQITKAARFVRNLYRDDIINVAQVNIFPKLECTKAESRL